MADNFSRPKQVAVTALAALLVSSVGFAETAKRSVKAKSKTVQQKSTVTQTKETTAKSETTTTKAPTSTVTQTPAPATTGVGVGSPAGLSTGQAPAGLVETVAIPSKSEATLKAAIEFRPSWSSKRGAFSTENNAELGYAFNKKTYVGYRQEFNTNLFDPSAKVSGMSLVAIDGILRADFRDVLVNKDAGLSFGYEPRIYLPTEAEERDKGRIFSTRQYLKVKKNLGTTTALTLMEVPILHVYNSPGTMAGGANPVFENRVYLVFDWTLIDGKLDFSFPVMFHNKKHRDFGAGAANNSAWAQKLWVYPELTYAVNKNFSLGLAYSSENLVAPDLSETTFKSGFESGLTQIVLRATL